MPNVLSALTELLVHAGLLSVHDLGARQAPVSELCFVGRGVVLRRRRAASKSFEGVEPLHVVSSERIMKAAESGVDRVVDPFGLSSRLVARGDTGCQRGDRLEDIAEAAAG